MSVFGSATRVVTVLVFVAAPVLLAPRPASAHVPHDVITQVIASPDYKSDGTLFAISRNRVLRSTNGGAVWSEIVNGVDRHTPVWLAAAPSDKRIMYMSNLGGGVYRSADQGVSWSPTATPAAMKDIAQVAVSPTAPDVVFAAGVSAGLFRTANAGQTWSAVGSFGRVRALVFPDSSGRIVVGDDSGEIFVSDNDGSTWVRSGGTTSGDPITALAATRFPTSGATVWAGTTSGRLLRSTNRGTSFAAVGSGLPAEPLTAIGVSVGYPTDTTVWVSTWEQGVYWSGNGGTTFTKRSAGLTTDSQATTENAPQFGSIAVAAAANGQEAVYLGGFDGLFRSDDKGTHWRELQTLTDYIVGLAVSPNYAEDATVIATTYVKGAYISSDRGVSWTARDVGLGTGGTKFAPIERLHDVQFSPNFANDGTIFSATWYSVLKSVDRGASWTTIPVGSAAPGTLRQFVIAVSPAYATDRTVYVGTRAGEVYRSKSAGDANTWSLVAHLGGRIRTLALDPAFAANPVLYAGATNGVFKSVDGGANWQATGPRSIALLAISPNYENDGTVFAGTEGGLFVTRDGGQVWTKLAASPLSSSTHVEALGVSPEYATDRTLLVSVLGKGLFRSTDGGTTFVETGASLIDNNLLIADFDNPSSEPIQFSPSYALDHTIFGFAQTHVVRSTDTGSTWQVLALPPAAAILRPPSVAVTPTTPTVVEGAAGTQRVMHVSVDLSHPYASEVTVHWRTSDVPGNPAFASAAAGDYVPASGTLVFPKGATREFADVVVKGDALDESDEAVLFGLSNPTNATIGGFWGLGFGIIQDDDSTPTVVPGSASIIEGDEGSSVLAIPVSLSAASGRTVTVDWATVDSESIGGQDFAPGSGTLTFLPGETTKSIPVTVFGDEAVEPDELLVVVTSNHVNARPGGFYGLGIGHILNDDG